MKMNTQPVALRFVKSDGTLQVHSIFKTIQGEGPLVGFRAVFIRLAGCNLQCPLCDTDYTSNIETLVPEHIIKRVSDLLEPITLVGATLRSNVVVITGGEPFRQNLTPLVSALQDHGYTVQIETNGTLPPSKDLPLKTLIICSPKTGSINKAYTNENLTALKYVLSADDVDEKDGLPTRALDHSARPKLARPSTNFTGVIYVQPIDVDDPVENKRHLNAAINSCLNYGYTLCLQVHKYLGME